MSEKNMDDKLSRAYKKMMMVMVNGKSDDYFDEEYKNIRDEYYKEERRYKERLKYREMHPSKKVIQDEYICECGSHITSHTNRHYETKKHKLYLKEKDAPPVISGKTRIMYK